MNEKDKNWELRQITVIGQDTNQTSYELFFSLIIAAFNILLRFYQSKILLTIVKRILLLLFLNFFLNDWEIIFKGLARRCGLASRAPSALPDNRTATHTNTGGQTDTRLYFSNSQTNISSRSLKSPEVFRGLIQRLLVRLHPSLMLKHKNHVFKVVSAFVAWMW